uniref:Uncharacterized protein n=1 Tax=Candidatus Kentrum sp. LFY TaxID=2126342 RepID=A0A450WN59_9GAMM|nr:MAG: hypothetical protein BECKLFY1418C_GA0070996_104323 [Candidatus Kentron sp. LFY]
MVSTGVIHPNPAKPERKFHCKKSAVISTVGRDLVPSGSLPRQKIFRAAKNDRGFFDRFIGDFPGKRLVKLRKCIEFYKIPILLFTRCMNRALSIRGEALLVFRLFFRRASRIYKHIGTSCQDWSGVGSGTHTDFLGILGFSDISKDCHHPRQSEDRAVSS